MLLTRSTYHRFYALLRHASIVAWTLALLASTSAAGASELVIDGAGDGHGVGMSQDGALGYAEHGWPYTAILSHYYTGTAIGQVSASTIVKVLVGSKVRSIPLEAYVRGVVSAEVSSSWPMAALQAQAVASRTFAITAHAGGTRFDVYSDDRSQVYLGKAAETSPTNAAVASTAGEIVTYEGQPAITYFFAGSGGHTESVQNAFLGSTPEPWLVGVADPYDAGPLHRWTVTMSFAAVASRLSGLVNGSFRGIEVLKRGTSPRIVSANVLGSRGPTLVSGPELAARLGLYGTWAYFSVKDSHGVHSEPDASGPSSTTPAATAQPARVTGAGGSPSARVTGPPTAQPARVTGAGGSPSAQPAQVSGTEGFAGEPSAQPARVNGQGGVSAG
jgi:SpoIID/LytB domain protein